ncbi:hypothetical protein [Saccharomonospora cyanea]|uniref:Uncharacterized protein n=1 Tax=Saccharomonospora cyanea NA-134 TaxID=882082 RepID=H5XCN4_9PSEU|nr:hypothetical protein [Saccharomonospora cyanea]EHR61280.1 hypothetical protein SaccyDRAFT_2406 [Saccharomonospora cyanea NA-134]
MTHTDLPDPTLDARSLGYAPSDGTLVRDAPFLSDVLRETRSTYLWWAWGAPLFALLVLGALLFGGPWIPSLLALVGVLLRWGWVLWRLPFHPTLTEVAEVPIRSAHLAADDIVLTRWLTAVRVDTPAGEGWVHGAPTLPQGTVVAASARAPRRSTRLAARVAPGSRLARRAGGATARRSSTGRPPQPTPPDHLVSAVPALDEGLSLWARFTVRATLLLAGLAVVLGAAMGTLSLLPLFDARPDVDPVWSVIGLPVAVVCVLWSLRVAWSTASLDRRFRRARGWWSLPARVDELGVDGPERYTFTATVWHPAGQAEQVTASGSPADFVAAVAETGVLWVLDSTLDAPVWTVGVPGHPVLTVVGRGC